MIGSYVISMKAGLCKKILELKNNNYLLCIVRKDMEVNEHERLFNITLRHKFK